MRRWARQWWYNINNNNANKNKTMIHCCVLTLYVVAAQGVVVEDDQVADGEML